MTDTNRNTIDFSKTNILGLTKLGCRVKLAVATQTLPTAVLTPIVFGTVVQDDGFFFPATPSKLIIPVTGWYIINGNCRWEANATGVRFLAIFLNNTTWLASVVNTSIIVSQSMRQNISAIAYLTAGDFIELIAMHTKGTDSSVNNSSDDTWFAAVQL